MVNKEVVFVKMLLEHGKFHSTRTSIIDRSIALTHFHQAVELIVKFRVKERKLGINDLEFERILNKLKSTKKGDQNSLYIPYWQDIFDLSRQRNNIYHNGLIHTPDVKAIYYFSKICEKFMVEFFQNEYNLDYNDISLIDLIDDNQIKEKLKSSKTEKETDIKKAVTKVDEALYYVMTKVLAKLGVYRLTSGGGFMISTSDGKMVNRDVLLAQGLLFGEDYEKIAVVQEVSQRKENLTVEDYNKIFNWVIEIARKTEEKYGVLPKVIAPWDK